MNNDRNSCIKYEKIDELKESIKLKLLSQLHIADNSGHVLVNVGLVDLESYRNGQIYSILL